MGINDRMIFVTPPADAMTVVKAKVEGQTCPQCGSGDVARYPVGHFLGPRIVTKCQACYHSLAVDVPTEADQWPPFRPLTYAWDPSPAEHAAGSR
jgi:ssDNA-binding Zn-finger/Zn-ribbon topoisomerase 1